MESLTSFTGVTPTDEGPYPCYAVYVTGAQILELMNRTVIDIDTTYQRGKSAPTKKRAGVSVHALKPSRDHIESIKNDLITRTAEYGRNLAIIPQIWLNCRRDENGLSKVQYHDVQPGRLDIFGKLYDFDGWHRLLAIKSGVRDQQIDPNRKFCLMIFDAPLAFEARAFRILNSMGMPVSPARVAWVSAPFGYDMMRVAWEFATSNSHLTWQGQHNFETVKSNVAGSAPYYASFLAISNGFAASPSNGSLSIWPAGEIDPANAYDRALVTAYMHRYWNTLVARLPYLGFLSYHEREHSRLSHPLLVNNLMMQVLLWIGHEYLRAAKIGSASYTYRQKLQYLLEPGQEDRLQLLFAGLEALEDRDLWHANDCPHKLFNGLVRGTTQTWVKNDYSVRRLVFIALKSYLGLNADSIPVEPPKAVVVPHVTSTRIIQPAKIRRKSAQRQKVAT